MSETGDAGSSWVTRHPGGSIEATRNNRLTVLRVLFNFAKQHNYLSKSETTEAESVPKVKTGATKTEIFEPEEFEKSLLAAHSGGVFTTSVPRMLRQ